MSLYMHGNLALKEQPTNQNRKVNRAQPVSQQNKKAKLSIPLGEKMLYLFAIMACVAVAGLILWQYAQIYEVNTRIQKVESEIQRLEKENNVLQLEGQRLQEPKRLLELGKELGFVPTSEEAVVPVTSDKRGVAADEKKLAYVE